MTKRTVQSGMVTYTDTNGVRRMGQAGEEVDVQADDLKRFDKLNGGVEATEKAAPVKKAAPKKVARRK